MFEQLKHFSWMDYKTSSVKVDFKKLKNNNSDNILKCST